MDKVLNEAQILSVKRLRSKGLKYPEIADQVGITIAEVMGVIRGNDSQTEVVTCPCGKIFAAAVQPYNQDTKWKAGLIKYQKAGCTVSLVSTKGVTVEKCTCPNMKPKKPEPAKVIPLTLF